jgi:hypothetical protein
MIACNVYEDINLPAYYQIMIPADKISSVPSGLVTFDTINIVLLAIYFLDNVAYVYTFGVSKKEKIYSIMFEFTLIVAIMVMSILELNDTSIRFTAFYLRLLDTLLIYRKWQTLQMLFVQNQMKDQYNRLHTEKMNPDERIIAILKFIEQNHKGIFKCVINEIRYCVKMISTGALNDVESFNKKIGE